MNYTGCSFIDSVIGREPVTVLIYGEAAAGKTALLLHIARRLSLNGFRSIFISTEGSMYMARVASNAQDYENVIFTEVYSLDEQIAYSLITLVLKSMDFKALFIDSINSLYRLEAYSEYSIEKLGLNASLMRKWAEERVGAVFASAQVRAIDEGDVTVSGMKVLEYWFDVILQLTKSNGGRVLRVLKPHNFSEKRILFEISSQGVTWIEPC
ncbi:MAG: AAA family ATPase [Desulfurococcaceae archaeon]